jgi:endonuclease YncB( thermonuclease family)
MRKRRRLTVAIVLVAVACVSILDHAGAFGFRADDRTLYDGATAIVLRVIDGDTIEADIPDRETASTRIRLIGVDCPEIGHAPGEQDAPFGQAAAQFTRMTLEGHSVQILLDPLHPTRDRYGRLLAYILPAQREITFNEVLVQNGMAFAGRRFDHPHRVRFRVREEAAHRAKAGLWAEVARK